MNDVLDCSQKKHYTLYDKCAFYYMAAHHFIIIVFKNNLYFLIPFPCFINKSNTQYDQHWMYKELLKFKAEYQFRAMYRTE